MFEKEAEEYVKAFTDRSHIWSNDKLMQLQLREAYKDGAKFGYNKGLEAGKPKWHDIRKNPEDLPKRDERFSTNISIAVMTQDNNFAFYCFDDKKWYFQGVEIGNVVAWCEIPKFKEVEV